MSKLPLNKQPRVQGMDFSSGWCSSWYPQVEPPEYPALDSFVCCRVPRKYLKGKISIHLLLQAAPVREESSGSPRVSPRLFINVPGFSCCVGKLVTQRHKSQGICWMEAPWLPWGVTGCWLPSGTFFGVAWAWLQVLRREGEVWSIPTASSVKIPQVQAGKGLEFTGAGIQCHLDRLGKKKSPRHCPAV